MAAHGFLATFAFGVYGDVVRITRFDHACGVASPVLSLKTVEGLKGIRDFFWRFVHPWETGPRAVVGCDSTIRKLTNEDIGWLHKRLASEASDLLHGIDLLRHARRVVVWDDTKKSKSRAFIAFKLIEVNARLFSCSTMVWLGVEHTRGEDGVDGGEDDDLQLCVIKEAWRQLPRTPEKVFYDRLQQTVPENEWVGIPHMVCGSDLGQLEAKHYEAARGGSSSKRPSRPVDFVSATSVADRRGIHGTLPLPLHQTHTWRLAQGADFKPKERSHMRFVVDVVGRPLSRFRSTRELAIVMRDSLKGHRVAVVHGEILHRDVSSGNILIVDRPTNGCTSKGVMHDFDYSAMLLKAPGRKPRKAKQSPSDTTGVPELYSLEIADEYENIMELKEKTGTYYFIALELIDPRVPVVSHDIHHDLESFFWVLLWMVLRHTNHDDPLGKEACAETFQTQNDSVASNRKNSWIQSKHPLEIRDNAPLTELLARFKKLVKQANPNDTDVAPVRLTYEAILAIFDDAIARSDRPANDAAIPFFPKQLPLVTVHQGVLPSRRGKASKRTSRSYATSVVSGMHTGSATLASNASGRSKRQKTTHDAFVTPALSSPRVASHTSRRSGRKAATSNATSGRTKVSGGSRGAKASASSSRNASCTTHS